MIASMLGRFLRHPLSFTARALRKLTVDRWRYARGTDYDAAAYWSDRFGRHGAAFRGVGDEGYTEAENRAMYQAAGEALLALCRKEGVDFASARVLEVGCGNGFYTRLLASQGAQHCTCVDITDAQFPRLRAEFPAFQFERRDVTADAPRRPLRPGADD